MNLIVLKPNGRATDLFRYYSGVFLLKGTVAKQLHNLTMAVRNDFIQCDYL